MIEQEGQSATEVCARIGVHVKTLYRWLSEYREDGKDAFCGKGNLKPADEELRLRREIRELREENEILKKAAAIFAKHRP